MSGRPTADTRTRLRTRRTILDAAAAVLSRDRTASLGAVADAAGIGRTTLHRYYADRASLIRALALDSIAATDDAIAASRISEGPPAEALERLVLAFLALGDRFGFLLGEPGIEDDHEYREREDRSLQPVVALLARGQTAGELRGDLPVAWMLELVGMVIYSAWRALEAGTIPREDAPRLVTTSLLRAIGTWFEPVEGTMPPGRSGRNAR